MSSFFLISTEFEEDLIARGLGGLLVIKIIALPSSVGEGGGRGGGGSLVIEQVWTTKTG